MGYTDRTDEITREYFNSMLVVPKYLDSDIADTKIELFGETFETPVMTAALSHLKSCDNAMVEFALGAKKSGALHFVGMGEDSELEKIIDTGAKTVKIIKPHADDAEIFRRIEHARAHGVFALGMDIDHSISGNGGYDNVLGLPMKTKSLKQLASFVEASKDTPFIVKGVLSVEDAKKCAEAGAAAIIVSHHHGIMPTMVPPLMMLPEIVDAVGKKMKIFVDCGFECGMDVYKALALGADAVGVGRFLMDPLKDGSEGVRKAIDNITGELKCVMARTGAKNLSEINDSQIRYRSF